MTAQGRVARFDRGTANGGSRRISPVPVRPGGGPVTEPTPAVQPSRREQLFMPQTRPSQSQAQSVGARVDLRHSPPLAASARQLCSDSRLIGPRLPAQR